jgi:hypothetical protein
MTKAWRQEIDRRTAVSAVEKYEMVKMVIVNNFYTNNNILENEIESAIRKTIIKFSW